MITFLISLSILIAAYFIYGAFTEKTFGADGNEPTPAITHYDGIDFVPIKAIKIFLIQFLNIAGLGPIFGAIAGALWGPVAFLWIVLGCIFIGSMHDYLSGMISLRHKGASISEIVGIYLGKEVMMFMRFFTVALLVLVGVVFIKGPSAILTSITGLDVIYFIIAIFVYYVLATMLPVDKIIGKVYPVFGVIFLFMAIGVGTGLIWQGYEIPELSLQNLVNMHPAGNSHPIYPLLFITIACGAISGFHATQSPMMARCLPNEKDGKRIFFGAMIAEGIVALIWAAAAMSFFGGIRELGETMAAPNHNAAWVVNEICNSLLGKIGGFLAIIGVVVAPITSGDTAFRSARLIISDIFKIEQKKILPRFYITIPLFVIGLILTQINFDLIWRYFGWANQSLAAIVLWTITAYLMQKKRNYKIALIPALFMTSVVVSYILTAPEGLGLNPTISLILGLITTIVIAAGFFVSQKRRIKAIQKANIKSFAETID